MRPPTHGAEQRAEHRGRKDGRGILTTLTYPPDLASWEFITDSPLRTLLSLARSPDFYGSFSGMSAYMLFLSLAAVMAGCQESGKDEANFKQKRREKWIFCPFISFLYFGGGMFNQHV